MANKLNDAKKTTAVAMLCEGSSIRAVERITGVHRDTIMRLRVRVGEACQKLLDAKMRNLNCSRIEVDELWGFIGKKKARASKTDRWIGLGDVWTFLSIDPETKLIPSFVIGQRDRYHTNLFMQDLASRLTNRIQLSSDAMNMYADAVENAFGCDIDYAQIVKEYSSPATPEERRRYSPATLSSVYKMAIVGIPNPEHVCTSYVERANLTMRTHCKRLARLTLAFSKKLANFKAAMALNIAYYNLVKKHGTLGETPAMAAGVERSAWSIADLVDASA
jgi:IS1 family transposase